MKPEDRHYKLYIEDIELSMTRILEAAKNIPNEIKEKYPEIPWRKMYGLRNLISHAYFGIDYEMIWEIITSDLPGNLSDIKEILEKEK